MSDDKTAASLPPGDYAIVQLFGHTTLIGRVTEIERFGTKMLSIEVLFRGQLLPPVLRGGAALYGFTPCSPEVAWKRQPQHAYGVPADILAIAPPLLLEGPSIPTSTVEYEEA